MRIAWYSNGAHTPTGYGTQTAQVLRRLKADGHDVDLLANYGDVAGLHDTGMLSQDESLLGIPQWSQGHAQYSLDVVDDQCKLVFQDEPGWVITLYDVWVLRGAFQDQRVISWTPIDHLPVPPEVATWCIEHRTIAMSKYGQAALADEGITADYIPHAIEKVFSPTESDIRKRMKVPDDAFLVMMNAANVGRTPPRKAWDENLQALAAFARDHDDVVIYLHTDLTRPNGVPLPRLINLLGIKPTQLRKPDLMAYRNGLIPDTQLAATYSASDVLLAVSMGEGFGVPTIEAMGCGTPAIVTNFSAQPELVGDTGWKVACQLKYNENHHAFLATPFVGAIREALEEAYAERGTDKAATRSAAAIAKAKEYDADYVYATHWRPLLAELEEDLKPKRKAMSKAAKRRIAKAAA